MKKLQVDDTPDGSNIFESPDNRLFDEKNSFSFDKVDEHNRTTMILSGQENTININKTIHKMNKKNLSPENYYSTPSSRSAIDKSKFLDRSVVNEKNFEHKENNQRAVVEESKSEDNSEEELAEPNAAEITEYIEHELMFITNQICKARNMLLQKILKDFDKVIKILRNEHFEDIAKRVRESCYSSECIDKNLGILHSMSKKRNEKCVKVQRKRFEEHKPVKFNIEVDPVYNGIEAPIFIENVYKSSYKMKKNKDEMVDQDSIHVFILIHGLGSSYIDLLAIMNEISIALPNAGFIYVETIARVKSHSRIQKLAIDISNEIDEKLNEEFNIDKVSKISFIAHSLGGVLARAALPDLLDYRHKFFSFCTLSSPHLGVVDTQTHIKVGTFFTEAWYDSFSVNQLRLADANTVKNTYLYKLSEAKGLEFFKHIYFFSSSQDSFVPYYSSRCQIFKEDLKRAHAKELYEMNHNILENCVNGITRVDVNFNIESSGISSMIGAAAHIKFLNDPPFLKVFVNRYRSTMFSP